MSFSNCLSGIFESLGENKGSWIGSAEVVGIRSELGEIDQCVTFREWESKLNFETKTKSNWQF